LALAGAFASGAVWLGRFCLAQVRRESGVLVGSCLAFGLLVRGRLASSAAFGFFVRGGLTFGAPLGLTGRSTGARLYYGFIVQLPVPRPVSFTLGVQGWASWFWLVAGGVGGSCCRCGFLWRGGSALPKLSCRAVFWLGLSLLSRAVWPCCCPGHGCFGGAGVFPSCPRRAGLALRLGFLWLF